jgi:glycosyltransferase involved in cell wall biosynthesis
MGPEVSVIVPSRNSGRDLHSLVEALSAQTLARDRFEVVIGDDGSSDGSTEDLADPGWLRVVRGPPRNSYAARNRAAAVAGAPLLAFCDADCRPDPQWLEAGLGALEGSDLVAGSIRFLLPERRTVWTLLDIDMFLDQERTVAWGRATTANFFVSRSFFDRVDGFDESLPSGGDYEFVSRCVAEGARLAFTRAAIVWHPTRDDASGFFRKLWRAKRSYGARLGRAGHPPHGLRLFIPLVAPMRARRRVGKSVRPDRRRLAENGVYPTVAEDVLCLLAMYGVVPHVSAAAELRGWIDGRRGRREAASPASGADQESLP